MRQCRQGHHIPEHEPRCRTCYQQLNKAAAARYRARNRELINHQKQLKRMYA